MLAGRPRQPGRWRQAGAVTSGWPVGSSPGSSPVPPSSSSRSSAASISSSPPAAAGAAAKPPGRRTRPRPAPGPGATRAGPGQRCPGHGRARPDRRRLAQPRGRSSSPTRAAEVCSAVPPAARGGDRLASASACGRPLRAAASTTSSTSLDQCQGRLQPVHGDPLAGGSGLEQARRQACCIDSGSLGSISGRRPRSARFDADAAGVVLDGRHQVERSHGTPATAPGVRGLARARYRRTSSSAGRAPRRTPPHVRRHQAVRPAGSSGSRRRRREHLAGQGPDRLPTWPRTVRRPSGGSSERRRPAARSARRSLRDIAWVIARRPAGDRLHHLLPGAEGLLQPTRRLRVAAGGGAGRLQERSSHRSAVRSASATGAARPRPRSGPRRRRPPAGPPAGQVPFTARRRRQTSAAGPGRASAAAPWGRSASRQPARPRQRRHPPGGTSDAPPPSRRTRAPTGLQRVLPSGRVAPGVLRVLPSAAAVRSVAHPAHLALVVVLCGEISRRRCQRVTRRGRANATEECHRGVPHGRAQDASSLWAQGAGGAGHRRRRRRRRRRRHPHAAAHRPARGPRRVCRRRDAAAARCRKGPGRSGARGLTDPGAAGEVLRDADVVVHGAADTDCRPPCRCRPSSAAAARSDGAGGGDGGGRGRCPPLRRVQQRDGARCPRDNPVPLPDDAARAAGPDSGLVGDLLEGGGAGPVPRTHPALALSVLRPAALAGEGVDRCSPALRGAQTAHRARWGRPLAVLPPRRPRSAVAHAIEHDLDGPLTAGSEGALLDDDVERLSRDAPAGGSGGARVRHRRAAAPGSACCRCPQATWPTSRTHVVSLARLHATGWVPRRTRGVPGRGAGRGAGRHALPGAGSTPGRRTGRGRCGGRAGGHRRRRPPGAGPPIKAPPAGLTPSPTARPDLPLQSRRRRPPTLNR